MFMTVHVSETADQMAVSPRRTVMLKFHAIYDVPDSKVHGAIMGPIWGRHVGPMNFAIWDVCLDNQITKYLSDV